MLISCYDLPARTENRADISPRESSRADHAEALQSLNRAVYEYRSGYPKRTELFLSHARRLAPRILDRKYASWKLEAFLNLATGNLNAAIPALHQSVALHPDPYIYYFLGSYYWQQRRYRKAKQNYGLALSELARSKNISKKFPSRKSAGRGDASMTPEPYLFPISCGENPRPAAIAKNPFADFDRSDALWMRKLQPLEHAALILLESGLNPRRNGIPQRDLNAMQGQTRLRDLLANPTNEAKYTACLRHLESILNQKKFQARRIFSDIAIREIHSLKRRILSMHRLRLLRFRNRQTYYSYGNALLRHGSKLEALHTFRLSLSQRPANFKNRPSINNIRELGQIYYRIADVYRMLGRSSDAATVNHFASIMERTIDDSQGNENISENQIGRLHLILMRQRLVARAHKNLNNREGLLLLLASASAKSDSPHIRYYVTRLEARDRKFDSTELISAFTHLLHFTGSQDFLQKPLR